ncbi:hypothetical protein G4H71_21240 [Rhodococcus triatomae]|uniref:Uncharacterized protein n=1 Tax=Rhodococcus triatomae TaxID=300028 RepID=A0A1G8K967_9NOCA|nr:hypothetical protein [Rhodococcus triatomae]QNG18855.1 hypothetical protein G4H72_09140 [Rhodococcus triatomae]QNG25233.1 hypothetical protein G4H71_21240 [Rhodococcus triatomae]SDI39907.1 hypothetical protein SAMN05444695_10760 [Rhodococcus triatomae]
MTSPSTTLAAWAGSWLRGESAPDDLVDALHRWAPMHLVFAQDAVSAGRSGLPYPEPAATGVAALLQTLRRTVADRPGAEVRLVLPAAGDVSTLPAGTGFAEAALAAGHGILVGPPGSHGIGVVPAAEAPDVLRWTVHDVPEIPLSGHATGLGEAEYAIREAVRAAADAVGELALVSGSAADARAAVAAALDDAARHPYPGTLPPRALRILDSADHVAAIVTAADATGPGGNGAGAVVGAVATRAVDSVSAAALEAHLRPLRAAVRLARTAAVNAGARVS